MDIVLTVFTILVTWRVLCMNYQRMHIALLGRQLSGYQLERHMETLTEGYTRAIHEADEARQVQVLESFAQTEQSVATQIQKVADAIQKENAQDTSIGILRLCLPYAERFLPSVTRDFRALLRIHAAGLRHVADNGGGWDVKGRAYHFSAELYLLQHSCHWFCKSRAVADARLMARHQVSYQKVLDSVSPMTRTAYLKWLRGDER